MTAMYRRSILKVGARLGVGLTILGEQSMTGDEVPSEPSLFASPSIGKFWCQ